jgi:hypothetical protein
MVRSPRATLSSAVARPRSLDLAIAIGVISAACSTGFLMTRVGRLAALDQQVRQLESFGAVVTDETYADLRGWVPYRPAIDAAIILIGWPAAWIVLAAILQAAGNRSVGVKTDVAQGFRLRVKLRRTTVALAKVVSPAPGSPEGLRCSSGTALSLPRRSDEQQTVRRRASFAEVFTVVVHASAIFAVRSIVAAPVNYARESLGGATSLGMVMPAFGESTFAARLLGAVDLFVVWWVVLLAMGLGILYHARTLSIFRWLFGAYAGCAAALALAQALRGGI